MGCGRFWTGWLLLIYWDHGVIIGLSSDKFNPCQLLIYGVLMNLWGFNPCQLLIYGVLMNLWGFNPCQLLIWNYLPMTDNFWVEYYDQLLIVDRDSQFMDSDCKSPRYWLYSIIPELITNQKGRTEDGENLVVITTRTIKCCIISRGTCSFDPYWTCCVKSSAPNTPGPFWGVNWVNRGKRTQPISSQEMRFIHRKIGLEQPWLIINKYNPDSLSISITTISIIIKTL
jgi:hypothetical protein